MYSDLRLHDETPVRVTAHNRGAVPLSTQWDFFERHVTSGKRGGSRRPREATQR